MAALFLQGDSNTVAAARRNVEAQGCRSACLWACIQNVDAQDRWGAVSGLHAFIQTVEGMEMLGKLQKPNGN